MKSVRDDDLKNKKVFLRTDFNVTMKEGAIVDDYRIQKAIPTIQFLLDLEAIVIIGTHLGRPKGQFNPEFSTVPVAKRLGELLGHPVDAIDQVTGSEVAAKVAELKSGQILMLGNLRFDPREETNADDFAQELASLAEVYVNDGFGVSHRGDASIDAITKFLPGYAGLLLESEITSLNLLLENPISPFVIVVGGAKIEDKAGILNYLSDKAEKILVGGAVANTFLAANGTDVSKSLIDGEMIETCKQIASKCGSKLMLPVDYETEEVEGGFSIKDIGRMTREQFAHEVKNAGSVFWNGNMGYTEDERFCAGTLAVAEAMKENENTKVAAGGDTVAFINTRNLAANFSFVSTGGGASMQFLSGEKLPGIVALERNHD